MNIQSISTSLPLQVNSEASFVPRDAKVAVPAQEKVTAAESTKPTNQEQLKDAVNSVREFVQPFNNNLEFSISDETKGVVVKIVDSSTKEVIRQIPSEEMLAMAKALDNIKGLFIKQMA